MTVKIREHEKYLEALKKCDDFVSIREWIKKFIEIYPDDFQRIDIKARQQKTTKNKTNGFRELSKRIRENLKTNEDWSGLIAAYDNSLPIKVKYVGNLGEKDMADFMDKLYNPSNNKKDLANDSFETIVDELGYFEYQAEDDSLLKRDNAKYLNKQDNTGIEFIDAFEYSSCIMLEMAHRNNDVINIINKIEYVQELMKKSIIQFRTKTFESFKTSLHESKNNINENIQEKSSNLITKINDSIENTKQLLELTDIKEPTIDDLLNSRIIKSDDEKAIQIMTLDYFSNKSSALQQEYKYIIPLSMNTFKQELEFFDDSSEVIGFFKSRNILNTNIQYLYKLSAIMELLQKKLDLDFFIYPNKYYKGMEDSCSYNIKCKNSIRAGLGMKTAMKNLNDLVIKESLQKFKELKQFKSKQYTMKDITDIFFMYDYYKARLDKSKPEITLNSIAKELKYALTIFYGIQDKKTKEHIKYEECLEKYDEFNGEASYYSTERHIIEKIKLLGYFIDKQHFRFLIFN